MEYPRGLELYLEYENELMKENRFFPNPKFLRIFEKIISHPDNTQIIPIGTKLYRARRNRPNQEFKYTSELGMNKTNPAINRASPLGIPYMYLADEPETAIAEIRANVNDYITVATYLCRKELKFITLRNYASYQGDLDDEIDSLDISGFTLFLSRSFSWPVQSCAETQYLPTQYFSEYCKKEGFAGVRYISSARGFHALPVLPEENHYNYVLFDEGNVLFSEAFRYKIRDINYITEKECEIPLINDGKM